MWYVDGSKSSDKCSQVVVGVDSAVESHRNDDVACKLPETVPGGLNIRCLHQVGDDRGVRAPVERHAALVLMKMLTCITCSGFASPKTLSLLCMCYPVYQGTEHRTQTSVTFSTCRRHSNMPSS